MVAGHETFMRNRLYNDIMLAMKTLRLKKISNAIKMTRMEAYYPTYKHQKCHSCFSESGVFQSHAVDDRQDALRESPSTIP